MQKKVVALHDISGIGKCSLTVALPIMSALKVQCCPFPTAVLSNQVDYSKYSFMDMTDEMNNYSKAWTDLGFKFDSIYTGFLGSKNQIDIVIDFIKKNKNSFIVVDPVMGDNKVMYDCFDEEMRVELKKLVRYSNMTTPNLTEACYLSESDYTKDYYTDSEILEIAKKVSKLGPEKIIITGILRDDYIMNFAYDGTNETNFFTKVKYNHFSYNGTGDIFTSIVCAMLTNGCNLRKSVKKATDFIYKTIEYTSQLKTDTKEGIMFEYFLNELIENS